VVLLIIYFLVAISLSFLCSIWEAVLLSVTPRYIKKVKVTDPELGKTLEEYKTDIDRPLSAILTLNTIAHTVGAIMVGAQASTLYSDSNITLGPLSLNFESIVAGLMTFAILIFSEIIPKTIGANNWESLTKFTVSSIKILLFILAPFVWLSQWITKRLKKDEVSSVLSRSDISGIADESHEAGVLDKTESNIIKNLLKLKDIEIKDVMTPRSVISSALEDETIGDYYANNKPIRFSRIPLFDDKKEHITGIILKDDLLEKLAEDQDNKTLKSIKREVQFVYNDVTLPVLFDRLTKSKAHIAVVVDKFGNILGIVTMEDIIETLLGLEITDELDQVDDLRSFARSKWEERAKNLGILDE